MYRIMIVEDDDTIAALLKKNLEGWGYEVFLTEDFSRVIQEFVKKRSAACNHGSEASVFNGYHWCDEIRRISQVPVLFLSSASDNMNMVMALSRGADDFMAKPFDLDVLVAKVQALIRRSYSFGKSASILEHRGAVLNMSSGSLTYEGQELALTRNEWKILELLFQQAGKVVSRDSIMIKLWENDSFVDDNTLTVNMTRLRKKLAGIGLSDFIVTKKGIGYSI